MKTEKWVSLRKQSRGGLRYGELSSRDVLRMSGVSPQVPRKWVGYNPTMRNIAIFASIGARQNRAIIAIITKTDFLAACVSYSIEQQ